MNLLQQLEHEQVQKLTEGKEIPDFAAGDTVRVNFRIVEGTTERVQAFEGVCIGRRNRGLHSSFTVRKLSHGEGVERVFPLFSPRVESIELLRRGAVRRAKLYYLRGLTGKAARITEKRDVRDAEQIAESREKKQAARAERVAALENKAPKATKEKKEKKAKKA